MRCLRFWRGDGAGYAATAFGERISTACKLAVGPAPTTPVRSRVVPVPARYHALQGVHAAHPGTGLGPAAAARLRATKAA